MWSFKKLILEDTPFGTVTFGHGAWEGEIQLPHPESRPVLVRIHAPKTSDLTGLDSIRSAIDNRYDHLAGQIRHEAVETYRLYAEEDVRHANISPEELEDYPAVDDAEGIWKLLAPSRIEVLPDGAEYDLLISYDVAWWNPHYFVAVILDGELVGLEVDG